MFVVPFKSESGDSYLIGPFRGPLVPTHDEVMGVFRETNPCEADYVEEMYKDGMWGDRSPFEAWRLPSTGPGLIDFQAGGSTPVPTKEPDWPDLGDWHDWPNGAIFRVIRTVSDNDELIALECRRKWLPDGGVHWRCTAYPPGDREVPLGYHEPLGEAQRVLDAFWKSMGEDPSEK